MAEPGLETRLSALAREGEVERLLELIDAGAPDDETMYYLAYKWLIVARDFGHENAGEMIDAVVQGSLYADDDNGVTGHAHFELAVAYLTGADGLPVDHDRARGHLREMRDRKYPDHVQGGEGLLAEARRRMTPAAQVVFDIAPGGHSDRHPQA